MSRAVTGYREKGKGYRHRYRGGRLISQPMRSDLRLEVRDTSRADRSTVLCPHMAAEGGTSDETEATRQRVHDHQSRLEAEVTATARHAIAPHDQ